MKKGRIGTVALILIFVAGLSLLLYPTVSNYWNSMHQSQAIVDYSNSVSEMDAERYARLKAEAQIYNRVLAGDRTVGEAGEYEDMLDPAGNGVMGYLEIPSIGCLLPIAHGTSDDVLKDSIGHIEWSSLPVGGSDTHCVVSGHRGLPSAELLTNIDRMEIGERFSIHVLGETLEYRVDQIVVVEPHDTSQLGIEAGKDYVTLLTCTPYGINSHRLLVRGVRFGADSGADWERVEPGSDGREVSPTLLTFVSVIVIVVIMFVALLIRGGRSRRKEDQREE